MQTQNTSFDPITSFGSLGGSQHTTHSDLMGGRTAITTEALEAYNNLRSFQQLEAVAIEDVGRWAFKNQLTNNTTPSGNDLSGVGLWYAMQGAKVGWIADQHFQPAVIADLQRTARLGTTKQVLKLARQVAQPGFIAHLKATKGIDTWINTLKMEPHYGGWMHSRAHGTRAIEAGAKAHDVNHLTVLSHDQTQPFMNDTFDWPQWPALKVTDQTVIDYFQGMVTLSKSLTEKFDGPSMIQTGAPTPEPAPIPTTDASDQAELDVTVNGSIWWEGFTADITLTNTSGRTLKSWSWSFDSPHTVSGDPWGAEISSTGLPNGGQRHTLTGIDWGKRIRPGESITVGFNGSQRIDIGQSGSLSADLLFGESALNQTTPTPEQNPAPKPTPKTVTIAIDPHPAEDPDYGQALELSLLFYEANRSGNLDESTNRVSWRGDSGLRDGLDGVYFGNATANNRQDNIQLDLTGGYHDAGDHVKFGLPLASTLSTLAWGGVNFAKGFEQSKQLDELLNTVRWGTDYLIKANVTDREGNTEFFIAQVGDGHADHALWSAPETQTIARPAMAVTPDKPGTDVAAASAAALAAASILFRENGEKAYANKLFKNATSLFEFADRYRGNYSDSITDVQPFYNSWSGYNDELAYGAAWLARAKEAKGESGDSYRNQASNLYHQEIGGLNQGWTHNWDDASYATAILLAEDANDSKAKKDVRNWLDSWVDGTNGVAITDAGLRFIDQWGSLRYSANTAMLAGIVADTLTDPKGRYSQLAQESIDYILGSNPEKMSYQVGYGDNFPQQPHHRAASGVSWQGFDLDQPNQYVLNGALVGGPNAADDDAYRDTRSNYITNEVAIDYNAGFTSALAFLTQQQI